MIRRIIKNILYILTRFFILVFLKIFTSFKVKHLLEFPVKKPVIIAGNHLSLLDAFIVCASFPLFSGVHFLKFMTDDSWINSPFGFFIKLLGAFPNYRGKGLDVSLKIPRDILRQRDAFVIFPRGKRIKRFHKKKGKIGAAAVALTANLPVIPVKIFDSAPGNVKNLFLRKRKVRVVIGSPILLTKQIGQKKKYDYEDFVKGTNIIIEKISQLH